MEEEIGDGSGQKKKDVLAVTVNKLLFDLVQTSFRSQEMRRYFDVAVVGYGGPYHPKAAMPVLGAIWRGETLILEGPLANPQQSGMAVGVDILANSPIREEPLKKKVSDGAGGVITIDHSMPIWVEATAKYRTPMRDGLLVVREIVDRWSMSHPDCLPPIVIHVTDGVFTDQDPSDAVQMLQSVQTHHGSVLLFNLHLSSTSDPSLFLPSSVANSTDPYAQTLFSWSSELPDSFRSTAAIKGHNISPGARGFAYNADAVMLSELLDIGTPVGLIDEPTKTASGGDWIE
jgi:hypothetical protein